MLWEDRRGVQTKGFGPHELLLACLVDDLGADRNALKECIQSHPRKGNGSLRKALIHEIDRFPGPVIAVVDRDQLHDLWPPTPSPPTCTSGLATRFRQDAPGDYDLVLFERNMESLVEAVCGVLGRALPPSKPRPDQRDQLLLPAVWAAPPVRHAIRANCPSFDRIVIRIARLLHPE